MLRKLAWSAFNKLINNLYELDSSHDFKHELFILYDLFMHSSMTNQASFFFPDVILSGKYAMNSAGLDPESWSLDGFGGQ